MKSKILTLNYVNLFQMEHQDDERPQPNVRHEINYAKTSITIVYFAVLISRVVTPPFLILTFPEEDYAFHFMDDTVDTLTTKISAEFNTQTEIVIKRGNCSF